MVGLVVAYAWDQDPYFRLTGDIATKLGLTKPTCIISKFVPSLAGPGKMTIFLSDTLKQAERKIKKYSYSGSRGDGSLADHLVKGGDPDRDSACRYLEYFEMDDAALDTVRHLFSRGEMTCSETKQHLIACVSKILDRHK